MRSELLINKAQLGTSKMKEKGLTFKGLELCVGFTAGLAVACMLYIFSGKTTEFDERLTAIEQQLVSEAEYVPAAEPPEQITFTCEALVEETKEIGSEGWFTACGPILEISLHPDNGVKEPLPFGTKVKLYVNTHRMYQSGDNMMKTIANGSYEVIE